MNPDQKIIDLSSPQLYAKVLARAKELNFDCVHEALVFYRVQKMISAEFCAGKLDCSNNTIYRWERALGLKVPKRSKRQAVDDFRWGRQRENDLIRHE